MLHRPASSRGGRGGGWNPAAGKRRLFTREGGEGGAPACVASRRGPRDVPQSLRKKISGIRGDDEVHFNVLAREKRHVAGLKVQPHTMTKSTIE